MVDRESTNTSKNIPNIGDASECSKNKTDSNTQHLIIEKEKLDNILIQLFQGKPCVQDLTSFFMSLTPGSDQGSDITNDNGSKNSNKQQSGTIGEKQEGSQDMQQGKESEMSKDKISSSVDNENEANNCQNSNDDEDELLMCSYCSIKIHFDLYNTHIEEKHSDIFRKKDSGDSATVVSERKRKKTESEGKFNDSEEVAVPKRKTTERGAEEVLKDTEKNKASLDNSKDADSLSAWRASFKTDTVPATPLYLCKSCKLATAFYDNAVEHAQNHILNVEVETELCETCNLRFAADFNMHRNLHLNNDDVDRDSFKYILYDHRVLLTTKWWDMFKIFPKKTAEEIKSASIYFPTRCVRLRLQNDNLDASENTLFQCITCNKYVDTDSVQSHAQRLNNCSKEPSSFSCHKCNRPFVTEKARDQHSSTHKDPNANEKYRTILFNDPKDLTLNKKLLHEAGNKIVVIDEERKKTNDNVTTEAQNKVKNGTVDKTTDNQKTTDIYECQCGLCFDRLEYLCEHLKNCSPVLKVATKTCKCGLVFDEENYDYHCTVHREFSIFKVKQVSIQDTKCIDVREMIGEFTNTTASER